MTTLIQYFFVNSKVFSIFDKYGTKTVKTIEDVVGLIGG